MGKFTKRGLVYLLIAAMLFGFCGCTRHVADVNITNEQTDNTDEVLTSESEKEGQPSKEETEPVSSGERTTADDNGSTTEDTSESTETEATVESSEYNEDDTTSEVKKEQNTESEDDTTVPTETVTKPTSAPTEPAVPTETATKKPAATEPATTKPSVTEQPTTNPVQETTTVKPSVTTAAPTTEAVTTEAATTPTISTEVTNLYTELESYSYIREEDILKARTILSSIVTDDMSDIQKIKAVHDWLVKNTTYDADYYSRSDAHYHLFNVLFNKIGVCQSYSVAFYVFMGELGIPCTFVVGSADNGTGSISHAWNAVMINNEWYFVDVTWDDPMVNNSTSYEDGYNMSYAYLLCPGSTMSKTHTANKFVKVQPSTLGTSVEYNDMVYKMSGYKDVFRITTYDDLNTELTAATESGTYVILFAGDDLDGQTAFDKVVEYLRTTGRGFSISGIYGTGSLSVTITYA